MIASMQEVGIGKDPDPIPLQDCRGRADEVETRVFLAGSVARRGKARMVMRSAHGKGGGNISSACLVLKQGNSMGRVEGEGFHCFRALGL